MKHLLFLLVLSLSGCVSLLPEPAPRPKSIPFNPQIIPCSSRTQEDSPKIALVIERPLASQPFDSKRLIINRENEQGLSILEPLADVEWNDRLPLLVQKGLISGFEKSGRVGGVGEAEEDFRADFSLQTSLKKAEIFLRGNTQHEIHIEASVRLVSKKDRKAIAQRTFKRILPGAQRTQKSLIGAYEKAFSLLIRDIVSWTLEESLQVFLKNGRFLMPPFK